MSSSPKISSFSIIVAFICIALAGLAFVPLLPIKLAPSATTPRLTVSFSMPNNSARIVEMEVTSRLEAMLARVKGIKKIVSTSNNGGGMISLELDKHTDVDIARFEVSTIIRQTWPSLPNNVSYPLVSSNYIDPNASRPFMTYMIIAPANPIIIQRYAEEHIQLPLSSIPSVGRVDITGATPMEWRLEYDNHQLNSLGISVSQIRDAINKFYEKEFLGTANIGENSDEWIRLALVPEGGEGAFDPSLITVTSKEGKLVRLDQLIKVRRMEEAPRSYYRINGLNSIYISIYAEETANQLDLAKKVKEEMKNLKEEFPQGYELHLSNDATDYIQKELNKIYLRTGLTVLILLLFVLVITRNFKYLFLIIVSLTINLCIAVIFFYLFKLEMQLYSLAGITISLSLVIDNTIVMTDHLRTRGNRKAFLSILTATLTTIGALTIIFFLDENIRLNLQDFAAVVIINLAVSLFIALFFVPAMMDKMGMLRKKVLNPKKWRKKLDRITRRMGLWFSRYYAWQIRFLCRWKKLACFLLVLAFGLPVFSLPDKINIDEDEQTPREIKWAERYNKIVTSDTYKEKVKPVLEKGLGGTLRLFVQKVYNGRYFTRNEEVVLSITATMPNGTTLDQMNTLVSRMEAYLSQYKEIRQFQTRVQSSRRASIDVTFKKEYERTGFPYTLKSRVISKALQLGGGSWGVYGLQDNGFNNDVRESAGSFRILMYGYNYDDLYEHAEQLKEELLTYRRIKEVLINAEFSWYKDDYQEFYFNLNKQRMAEENISPYILSYTLDPIFTKDAAVRNIIYNNEVEYLKLYSKLANEYDIWNMEHAPVEIGNKFYKLSELAVVEKGQVPPKVVKENQQYRLCIQYEYIGAHNQGTKIQERILKDFNKKLPVGYTAQTERSYWSWGKEDNKQYFLLLLIIVIIFFTTSILFNSIKQPFAVIFVIPISYIGVFLTFYWFKLNFDQGGFASFVLLCGITVNASIYILNEYNQIRERFPKMNSVRAYVKAWNAKITPIFLTVVSTILGFIPFMIGSQKEGFWFPLAAGTIGGLTMSVVGIFFYLPIFTIPKKDVAKKQKKAWISRILKKEVKE